MDVLGGVSGLRACAQPSVSSRHSAALQVEGAPLHRGWRRDCRCDVHPEIAGLPVGHACEFVSH